MAVVSERALLRRIAPLTLGHGAVDLTQGAVPAAIPVLVERFHLGYAQAGVLAVATTISSSIVQPLFGVVADGGRRTWLLPAGVAASAGGLAVTGLMPTFALALVALLVSGLGIAAYHPEGARSARLLAGDRPGAAMSFFSVGGNIGAALGPLVAGISIAAVGVSGTLFAGIPGLVALPIVWWTTRGIGGADGARRSTVPRSADRPGALAALCFSVVLRGYVYFALLTFVALYEHDVRHRSTAAAGAVVALFLTGGVIGTLLLGRITDRVGAQHALAGSFVPVAPLVACYALVDGPLGLLALTLAGAGLIGTFSVSIVLAQCYLPSRVATASGLLLGIGIGSGGLAAPLVGALADAYGLQSALLTAVGVALVGAVLMLLLPAAEATPSARPEPAV